MAATVRWPLPCAHLAGASISRGRSCPQQIAAPRGSRWARVLAHATELPAEALATAATILSASSDTDSSLDGADSLTASLDLDEADTAPLLELESLSADSLSLAVGLLRQHTPVGENEGDVVQLSTRLLELLQLLKERPAKAAPSSAGTASPLRASDDGDSFWGAPDEWADIRSALMSIGVADVSLDEEDAEEDVWSLEEGPPARRTRVLRSLPKLDGATAAQLSSFLAELQARASGSSSSDASREAGQSADDGEAAAAADMAVSDEEERWWGEVNKAYSRLAQQARTQQLFQEVA